MNQVELLLRLSESARDEGDDIARRHHEEREVHKKKLNELWRMIEAARGNVWSELSRFGLNEEQEAAQARAEITAREQAATQARGLMAGSAQHRVIRHAEKAEEVADAGAGGTSQPRNIARR